MKSLFISMFLLMAAGSASQADAITFEATVNSPRVSLDQVLQLTLTFTGVNKDLDPISLPVMDGFSTKYLGPSTSVSIINGDYHSERSFIYNLFPEKVGHFQVPPITAQVDGNTYTTKPIDVEVFESTTQAQAGAPDQNQAPTQDSLKDKIKIMVSVENTQVYLNQRVPITIKLLVNNIPIRDIQFPVFDKTGILVDDYQKPEQSSEVIDGVRYDTVVFKTNIYPNRLGDISLGPVQIQGNVLYKTGESNPFGQDNDVLGAGSFFNNFFDSYATRPVTITSPPIPLHVSALPEDGVPSDFSGAIGQFEFQASVSPNQVKAGDPLTLKMDVQGSGNFKNIKMPVFKADGFKTYDPQIKDNGNDKISEQVIIPTRADIKEVPALNFSYFDTSLKSYKTITQGPFSINVTAPNPDQEFKAIGFADISKENAALTANQFSFGNMVQKTLKVVNKLMQSLLFWLCFAFLVSAGIVYFVWSRFQDRLVNDRAFARRVKALKEANKTLEGAQGHLAKFETKEFYGLLSKTLHDFLADKWYQSSAALSTEEILRHLKSAEMDQAHLEQIKTILETSDMVCFAGASRDAAQMRADLAQTRELITHLEKSLK